MVTGAFECSLKNEFGRRILMHKLEKLSKSVNKHPLMILVGVQKKRTRAERSAVKVALIRFLTGIRTPLALAL